MSNTEAATGEREMKHRQGQDQLEYLNRAVNAIESIIDDIKAVTPEDIDKDTKAPCYSLVDYLSVSPDEIRQAADRLFKAKEQIMELLF